MNMTLKKFVSEHPYAISLVVATSVNLVWYSSKANQQNLDGAVLSALAVGAIVGGIRVKRWQDLFWYLPPALGSFVVAVYLLSCFSYRTRTTHGDMDGMVILIVPFAAIVCSPILLVGECLGWGAVVIYSRILRGKNGAR